MALRERFLNKINKQGLVHPTHGQCWEWTGKKNRKGYGLVWCRYRQSCILAHRVSALLFGLLDVFQDDDRSLHKCDNRSCVRPDHLWIGTQTENTGDMCRKGRNRPAAPENHVSRKYPERLSRGDKHYSRLHPEKVVRGERQGLAKLTESKVQEIRYLHASGQSPRNVASQFAIAVSTVHAVVTRRLWRHVP